MLWRRVGWSGRGRVKVAVQVLISPYISKVLNKNKRSDLPEFRIGDTIKVHVKIREGDKERLQVFEGVLIARKNSGMGKTITVRKISFSQGVERIFPLNAPVIDHIDVVRTGRVRRSKLYYLRALRRRGCPPEGTQVGTYPRPRRALHQPVRRGGAA